MIVRERVEGMAAGPMSAVAGVSTSAPVTVGAPRCQQPQFRSMPGTAEGFVIAEPPGCASAASALIVHRAREVVTVDAGGVVVPFRERRTREVVQVAAACLLHVASALRLNETERRVLSAPTTSTLRVREHVEVLRLGAPVRAGRVA